MRRSQFLILFAAFGTTLLAGARASGRQISLEITLAHNNAPEIATRDSLVALSKEYDLQPWTWTRSILIEQYAIPHSDPVLTLNTRHQGVALLSSYIHEQLHRFEDLKPREMARAISVLEKRYPDLPTSPPAGAADRLSSYTHIVTCYSELEALSSLVGRERAVQTIKELAKDHYGAIYELVLTHEEEIGKVVKTLGLMPNLPIKSRSE